MSQALSFQSVEFDVIQQNQQPWVRGIQIGSALKYENPDAAIRKLYQSHADEFTDAMTAVITLPTEGGPQETRIFSLRGCHLLAMFARTPVAKQFRRWVLDVLDKLAAEERAKTESAPAPEPSPISKRTDPERKQLTAIINTWVGMALIHYANARAQVNAHFGVTGVDKLTVAQVKEAIAWVQAKIDALPPVPEQAALPPVPALPIYRDGRYHLPPIDNPRHKAGPQEAALMALWKEWCWRELELKRAFAALEKEIDERSANLFHHAIAAIGRDADTAFCPDVMTEGLRYAGTSARKNFDEAMRSLLLHLKMSCNVAIMLGR